MAVVEVYKEVYCRFPVIGVKWKDLQMRKISEKGSEKR